METVRNMEAEESVTISWLSNTYSVSTVYGLSWSTCGLLSVCVVCGVFSAVWTLWNVCAEWRVVKCVWSVVECVWSVGVC